MASLEQRYDGKRYRIVFSYQGKRFSHSLGNMPKREAQSCKDRLEENLRFLERGLLVVPSDADLGVFLVLDGKLNTRPVLEKPLSLGEFLSRWNSHESVETRSCVPGPNFRRIQPAAHDSPPINPPSIAEHLLSEGMDPGNLLDSGDRDEVLAGFIFTTGQDGYVFIGETESGGAKDGEATSSPPTPLGRRRFTAAHELGHFLLHKNRMVAGRWMGDTKDTILEGDEGDLAEMEREADRFAAELLMPANVCRSRAEAFVRTYRVCPLQAFAYHLSSELLVSPEAMRNRLKGFGGGR